MAKGYWIARVDVADPAEYQKYVAANAEPIARFGGRFLVRGGAAKLLEGDWSPKRLVILEFPDMTQLEAWYHSAAYRPLLELRARTTNSTLVAVEGVAAH